MDVEFEWDEAQSAAARYLEEFSRDLGRKRRRGTRGGPVAGVYLWGPVGRGKTVLMDDFFERVPTPKKRVHFHEFFDGLHREAHRLGGTERALRHLLRGVSLLCFDEFHVHDVGDATLVAQLLNYVAERRIALVATSNYPPEGLLPNPLFHHVFVPSIEWIEQNLVVLSVDAGIDYRTGGHAGAVGRFGSGRYLVDAVPSLPAEEFGRTLRPSGHRLVALDAGGDAVWFDFRALCDSPTAASDYLALTEAYRTWTVSGVPRLGSADADAVRRFGNVVDVLYDADVALTVIAEVPLRDLTAGAESAVDLDRLHSRLSLLTASEPANVVDLPVREGSESGGHTGAVSVEDLAEARVDADVGGVAIEDDHVTGGKGPQRDVRSDLGLLPGGAGKADTGLAERPLHQPGAVPGVRPGATPQVGLAGLRGRSGQGGQAGRSRDR